MAFQVSIEEEPIGFKGQPQQVVRGQGEFVTTLTGPSLGGNWLGDPIAGSMSLDLAQISFTRLDARGNMYFGEREPSDGTDVIRWKGSFGQLGGAIDINKTPIQTLVLAGSWTATATDTIGTGGSCDQQQLSKALEGRRQELQDIKAESCVGDEDFAFCMKQRAKAMARVRAEISLLETQVAICRLLVGTWKITADDPESSGVLTIRSWDASSLLDAVLVLDGDRQTALLAPTYDPGSREISITASFDLPPAVFHVDRVYLGHLNPDARPPTGQGDLEPTNLGHWTAEKVV